MFYAPAPVPAPKRVQSGPELLLRSLGFGELLNTLQRLADGGLAAQTLALVTQENIDKAHAYLTEMERTRVTLERIERLLNELEPVPSDQSGDARDTGPGSGSGDVRSVGAQGINDDAPATDGTA